MLTPMMMTITMKNQKNIRTMLIVMNPPLRIRKREMTM